MHWLKPELVAEIEFAGWTGDGMVRQAAFKGLREDKPAEEVEAETPAPSRAGRRSRQAQTEASRSQRAGGPADGKPAVMGVAISKPDKPLWPDAGDGKPVTKLDLAHYYEAVGDWMIGISRAGPARSSARPTASAASCSSSAMPCRARPTCSSWSRSPATASPICRSTGSKGWPPSRRSAGSSCIPGTASPASPKCRAGWCSISIPAPDVAFADVIEAAREMRERLEALGLVSFCKTTGGKGLHVVTPLAARREGHGDWTEAKAFAQGGLPAGWRATIPDRYLVNMAKKAAQGPDLPRLSAQRPDGDRGRAAVAARAAGRDRVDAADLGAGARRSRSEALHRAHRAGLLAKSTAWDGYDDAAEPIKPAMKKLAAKL